MQHFDIDKIIVALKSTYGKDFLDTITMQLHQAIGAQFTFIAKLNRQRFVSETVSLVAGDDFAENFEYSLEHTPCANVGEASVCVYPSEITSLFPRDQLLVDMGVEGYVGAPLQGLDGDVFGIVVALFSEPIKHADDVAALFELFAGRISAELERLDKEMALNKLNRQLEQKVEKQKKTEAQLLRAKEQADMNAIRLKIANDSAGIGVWEWDLSDDSLVWDDWMYVLYGVSRNDFSGAYEAWESSVHPEDIGYAKVQLQKTIQGEGAYDTEFRVVHPNGNERTIKASAEVIRDNAGKALKVVGVNYDITDKVNALAEQKKAKKIAESANRSKGEFLANMSHEIRTPMNAILGGLQLLKKAELSQEFKTILDNASSSATSLLTIINDILDYSKIEENRLEFENEPFSLIDVIKSVKFDVDTLASNKGITFDSEVADGFVDGWLGDVVRVKQILLNLVSNAVKFTNEGRVKVELTTVEYNGRVAASITVKDSGIGMSEEAQSKIFDRFSQADSTTTRRFGGTGLGMAITINLIKMMGGTIDLSSQLGQGTTIAIILPLEQTDADIIREASKSLAAPDLTRKKILIAEDNEINQAIIQSMLNTTNATLTIVENGALAVEAVKRTAYDLILMDIQMPEMDGLEAQQLIQSLNPNLPVIALTANVMVDDVKSYLNQGFAAHIGKPIDMSNLYGILSKYLAYD